jgi:acetylornithine deacetylase
VLDWLRGQRSRTTREFRELVAFDTVSPHEQLASGWLRDYFEQLGARVRTQPRHPNLPAHPAANHNAWAGLAAGERANLTVAFPRRGIGPHTLFSAHVDVVPLEPGFADGLNLRAQDGIVVGRGVVDTKGNILMLGTALRYLHTHGLAPSRDISIDLVIEEEIGGNGALSSTLHAPDADEVVVLEPTSLEVLRGHRGCLEFAVRVTGTASHMGGSGQSAIRSAMGLIDALDELEAELVTQARTDAAFASWERPLQLNVGTIQGGQWPGSLPQQCQFGGFLGFHPRHDAAAVRQLLTRFLTRATADWKAASAVVEFPGIHNEGYVWAPDSTVERDLRAGGALVHGDRPAMHPAALPSRAWAVSCDARLYAQLLRVPTVIFGAGRLDQAHASDESLSLAEWERGVAILAAFLTGDASHGHQAVR